MWLLGSICGYKKIYIIHFSGKNIKVKEMTLYYKVLMRCHKDVGLSLLNSPLLCP